MTQFRKINHHFFAMPQGLSAEIQCRKDARTAKGWKLSRKKADAIGNSLSLMNGAKSVLSGGGALYYTPRETYQFRQEASLLTDSLSLCRREPRVKKSSQAPRRWNLSSFALNVIEMRGTADKFCTRPLRKWVEPSGDIIQAPSLVHSTHSIIIIGILILLPLVKSRRSSRRLFALSFWHASHHRNIHHIFFSLNETAKIRHFISNACSAE